MFSVGSENKISYLFYEMSHATSYKMIQITNLLKLAGTVDGYLYALICLSAGVVG